MAKLSADATLFGMDLSGIWAHLRQLASTLPIVQSVVRAIPATPVALVDPDSSAEASQVVLLRSDNWIGAVRASVQSERRPVARFSALLLPEDLCLTRSLNLPLLSQADVDAAVQLEVLTHSPFAQQDTVSAYRVQPHSDAQQLQVQMVLASRLTIEELQKRVVEQHQLKAPPEVWAPATRGAILCPGWGEQLRLRYERLQYWRLVGATLLLLILLAAVALTPSLKLRQQVLQAQEQTQALVGQTSDVAAQRQMFMAQVQTLSALSPQLAQNIDPLKVLLAVTRLLPDDTAVQSLTLEGNRLSLQGLSDNASRVQTILSEESGFRSVRLPSAITRDGDKESFVLEAELDPATFTLWQLPQERIDPTAKP